MSNLKVRSLTTLDSSREIQTEKIAEMNGGFSFRNKIDDGRFDFWYEGTTKNFTGSGDTGFFTSTMWRIAVASTTGVHSQGVLSLTDLPEVPTAKYYSRSQITSVTTLATSQHNILQRIEDVRTLAGKTVTLSWYARSAESRDMSIEIVQNFGNGSGASAEVIDLGKKRVTLTPTFQRFSSTFTMPSIVGKNIVDGVIQNHIRIIFWFSGGTSFSTRSSGIPEQTGTFDIACVQLEEGPVATPFEVLPIEISQYRLNRYFNYIEFPAYTTIGLGTVFDTTNIRSFIHYPRQMRAIPVVTLPVYSALAAVGVAALTAISVAESFERGFNYTLTSSGLTVRDCIQIRPQPSAVVFIADARV